MFSSQISVNGVQNAKKFPEAQCDAVRQSITSSQFLSNDKLTVNSCRRLLRLHEVVVESNFEEVRSYGEMLVCFS